MELPEVRKQIDAVDSEIRQLFIRRMELAEQVARIKAQTDDGIYKPDREQDILIRQSSGMPDELTMEYRALLRRTMEISRKYQYGLTLRLRDCFPFSYRTEESRPARTGVLKEELYLFTDELYGEDRSCITFSSLEALSEALEEGRIDAGAGVLETIGSGVNDALHHLLPEKGFYIHACTVKEDEDERKKTVMFGRELIVLPAHNRVRIVFTAPNRSGILGSLLCMVGDYGVNITHIHSMPFQTVTDDGRETWNYRFFLELHMNALEETSRALLFQLWSETQDFRLLGSYRCEGDLL